MQRGGQERKGNAGEESHCALCGPLASFALKNAVSPAGGKRKGERAGRPRSDRGDSPHLVTCHCAPRRGRAGARSGGAGPVVVAVAAAFDVGQEVLAEAEGGGGDFD